MKSTLILNIGCCPRWPETSRNGSSSLHIYIQPHPDNCIYSSRTEKYPLNGHLYKQCQHDCIIYYWQYDSHYSTCISILLIFIFSISNNCARASSPHEAAVSLAVPAPAGHHAVELLVVDAAVTVNVRLLSHGI